MIGQSFVVVLSLIYNCECVFVFFFQAEDGIRDLVRSRGLGDVYKRQAQRLAWFKNLHVWFDDPQRRRARTVEFDKKADSLDVSASQRLLDWAVPASTGIYLQPPPKAESLATNLLRVEHLGPYIYAAPSDVRGWSDVNARLRAAGRDLVDDVAWRSNTLFSFRRLDQPPLDALVDDAPERFDVEEFAEAESDDDRHLVVRLLNNTLKDMFRGHLSLSLIHISEPTRPY